MEKPIHFSKHAFDRVLERLTMNASSVAKIISGKKCIKLGTKPGLAKDHILFYSNLDNAFFVAIQDSFDGTVITILPENYHDSCGWQLNEELRQLAKELVMGKPPVGKNKPVVEKHEDAVEVKIENISKPPQLPQNVYVKAVFKEEVTFKIKSKLVGKIPRMLDAPVTTIFLDTVKTMCSSAQIPYDVVVGFIAHLGSKGERMMISKDVVEQTGSFAL